MVGKTFLILLALIMMVCMQSALADGIYYTSGTHDITTVMPTGKIDLFFGASLNLLPGGVVTGGGSPQSYGLSSGEGTINVNGGSVTGGVGNMAAAIITNYGPVNVYDGRVVGGTGYEAYGVEGANMSGSVNVYGGYIASGNPIDAAITVGTVRIYGGTIVGDVKGSSVEIRGGSITGDVSPAGSALDVYEGSTIVGDVGYGRGTTTIHGGNITGCIEAGAGTVNICGGTIFNGSGEYYNIGVSPTSPSSVVNIYGGSITVDHSGTMNHVFDIACGTVNLYGGTIAFSGTSDSQHHGSGILESTGGVLNVFGSDFNYPMGLISGNSGHLTGTLTDGSPLDLRFSSSGGQIILHPVPEPATLTLMGIGGLAVLRRRQR